MGPLLSASGTDEGEEFTGATEENQVRFIERWIQRGIPIDVWWIDAGWYPCFNPAEQKRRWTMTGTWEPDPERFPNGLKPVSERAARYGADLLLWFEPERVRPGTALADEHPDWLLGREGSPNRLLNLGNPECRRWLTEHVCRLIRENGIRIYRQDYNFEPLEHWRSNEPEDRQGINENLHVQGYLQYWDDLLARNPGLWIDSCASGGRRNDLETMRRSVPLHYTDFGYGDHPVKLSFHHVLFEWMPYFKEVTLSWDLQGQARYDPPWTAFPIHCGLGPMIMPCIDIARDDYDFELMKRMLVLWRRAAELMLDGDYYPLTPIHRSPEIGSRGSSTARTRATGSSRPSVFPRARRKPLSCIQRLSSRARCTFWKTLKPASEGRWLPTILSAMGSHSRFLRARERSGSIGQSKRRPRNAEELRNGYEWLRTRGNTIALDTYGSRLIT